LTALDRLHLNQ